MRTDSVTADSAISQCPRNQEPAGLWRTIEPPPDAGLQPRRLCFRPPAAAFCFTSN